MLKKTTKKDIVVYAAKSGAIELRNAQETFWATQAEIAKIFDVRIPTVNEHIKRIYSVKELSQRATIRKNLIVRKEGNRMVKREINEYNLDMLISVGYRVNSKTATQFRIWATKMLKQHITKGYTLNTKVIKRNQKKFLADVERVQKMLPPEKMVSADQILELIKAFSGAWFSLASYDEDIFPTKGFTKKSVRVEAYDLSTAVGQFKKALVKKKQASDLFAQEKKEGALEGIFGNVVQRMYDKDAYESIEEKAAHLLYFIVKNHVFTDGNKRTGAFAFVWFLRKSGIKFEHKITPEALTAITLLIAESEPAEKERMIGLVLLLLHK